MSDGNDFAIECFVYRSNSIRAREIRSSNRNPISLPPPSSINRASAITLHLIYVSGLFGRRVQPASMWHCLSSNVVKHAGSLAKQIKTENQTIWKLDCTSIRTNLERCWHVIFTSVIWFRARGNGCTNSSKIENRNFTAQKINQVVRTCLNILWKCKLRLVGEYGIFEVWTWVWAELGRASRPRWPS
jgi:hypothetical protein